MVRELEALGCFRPAPLPPLFDAALTLLSAIALFVLAAQVPIWAGIPLFAIASVLHARIGWAMHDARPTEIFSRTAGSTR